MITAKLIDGNKLIARIERMYPALRAELRNEILALAFTLSAKVKAEKLTGQVLNVRTGRLRRSITAKLKESGHSIYGVVGTNVKYGAAWEFGFEARGGAGARGGPHGLAGKALERYYRLRPTGIKHYPARPFLRPSLLEMRLHIRERLQIAIGDAARKAIKE